MPFDIQIRYNPAYKGGSSDPRYFLGVDLSRLLPRPVSSVVPVFWRSQSSPHTTLKEVYWADIAGIRLEKGNLNALVEALPEALAEMASFGTFPYYQLSWPASEGVPVYHSEGSFHLKLEGRGLSGDDIGEVWQRAGDFLLNSRRISSREDLEVSLLLWKDLRLYPTGLAFKGGKVWLPIFFSSAEQELIYDIIGVPSRSLKAEAVFQLRREVSEPLVATRTLSTPSDLGVDALLPQVWEGMKEATSPTGSSLTYSLDGERVEMPIYEVNGEVCALLSGERHRLFFAATPEDLVRRLVAELGRERKLPTGTMVNLEKSRGG